MPMYDYKCPTCGSKREVILKLADIDSMVECLSCSGHMNRQVSAAHVVADYAPYTSPVTGAVIEGRKAHREDLARHGCRVFEPGERESFLRRKQADDSALERVIDESVDASLANMTTDQRDAVGAALDHGLTPEIVRG